MSLEPIITLSTLGTGIRHIPASLNTFAGFAGNTTNAAGGVTGLGYLCLNAAATVNDSVGVGSYALRYMTGGVGNTAVGSYALEKVVSVGNNTAVGDSALRECLTDGSTAVGYVCLDNATTGLYNNGFGRGVLGSLITGSRNCAFGNEVLASATGSNNAAFGHNALYYQTTGSGNVAIGRNAGLIHQLGSNNVFIGDEAAGVAGQGSDITNSIVIGRRAVTPANNSIVIGTSSHTRAQIFGGLHTHGALNVASNQIIGYGAGYSVTGGFNTLMGVSAGYSMTTGVENEIIGWQAGFFLNGSRNVAIGNSALQSSVGGVGNTAVGYNAGLLTVGTSGLNSYFGYQAGYSITTGTYNTFLGCVAGQNAGQKVDATNSTAIGYNAFTTADNQVVLGGVGTTQTVLRGSVQLPNGYWHTSSEATPKERTYYAADGTTYLKGHGTFPLIIRNGSDVDILETRATGTVRTFGPLFVGAGAASDGRRLLSGNYDGSAEGHFISGLVSERSTSAIGLSWGMYQDNSATWLSGWNYASLRRTALLLDHGSLRFIASPSATTASPGAALPSQPATVFYVDTLGQVVTNGSVTCRYGVHIADLDGANAGVSQWLIYKNSGVGQTLNVRDIVNSRQQMQFYPGANGAAALTDFRSRVFISEGGLAIITNSTDFGYLGTDNYIGGTTYFRSSAGAPSGTSINGATGAATFGGPLTTVGDLKVINTAPGSTGTPSVAEIELRFGSTSGLYLAGYVRGKGYASNFVYADIALSANPNVSGSDNLPDDVILRGQTGNVEIIRGAIVMSNATKLGIRTIATLPSAASSSGDRYQVSNSATIANRIAFSNGTAWYYEGTAVAV